jgi:hypothetical protein
MPRQIRDTFSPADPSRTYSTLLPLLLMDCDAEYDKRDARGVLDGRDLTQHDRADDGGEDRQQSQHQRERGAGQPGHGQLIDHVGIT